MKENKGFTLIELVVVIAIIAIISAITAVGYGRFLDVARDSKAEDTLRQVKLEAFLEAGDSPYTTNVGDELIEIHVNVIYDYEKDEMTFTKDGESPTIGEASIALENLLDEILDDENWVVNPETSSTVEVLNLGTEGNTVEIEYLATNGGTASWIPTIILQLSD